MLLYVMLEDMCINFRGGDSTLPFHSLAQAFIRMTVRVYLDVNANCPKSWGG